MTNQSINEIVNQINQSIQSLHQLDQVQWTNNQSIQAFNQAIESAQQEVTTLVLTDMAPGQVESLRQSLSKLRVKVKDLRGQLE